MLWRINGYPRYTKDIDFWIWAAPENAHRIVKAIRDFGFGTLGLSEADFLATENIIQIGQEPNRIDLILEMEGMDFQQCYALREEVSFENIPINFIDLDSLIQSKRIAGRRKDLVDVDELKKQKKRRK